MPTFTDGSPASGSSGGPTYLTIAELIEAGDARTVAQLGSDSGTRLTFSDPPEAADDTEGILTNAIERASSEVAMYARRGGRYDADRLDELAAEDDWSLKGLVATLTFRNLHVRRSGDVPPAIVDAVKRAEDLLVALAAGDVIFADPASETAGNVDVVVLTGGQRGRLGLVSDEPFFRRRRTYEI
jgi:hypothetical protein